jgi:hypothetical protein
MRRVRALDLERASWMLRAIARSKTILKAWRPKLLALAPGRDRAFEAADAGAADPVVKVVDKAAPGAGDHLKLQPEVEKSLLDAGMPAEGSSLYDGPKRAADTPEDAARKFVLWAQAVGAVGTHTVRTISALYWECAEVDHREPVAINRFLRVLKAARCVRQDASTSDRRLWIIDPPEAPRIPKAQLAVAAKTAAKVPHLHSRVLQRLAPEREYSSPQLLRALAHDARRQGRARKQRGSRNVRTAP